jgi:general secretion pathway protein G
LSGVRSKPACRRLKIAAGFSLIELLVVIAIMSVLATVAMPLAELSHRRTQEEDLRRSLREIRTAIDVYKRLVDSGRIARSADGTGYPPSLDVLVDGVVDAQSPSRAKLYLLRRLPRDPFAPGSIGNAANTWGLRSYASSADDPQPGDDVYDVFSRSPDRGLDGVLYREW